jgi:hypothetical protein
MVLLVLQLCLIFPAAPLAAKGLPIARPIIDTMALAVVVMVVMLSHRSGAIAAIVSGAGSRVGKHLARIGVVTGCRERPPPWRQHSYLLRADRGIVACGLSPGRITFHRLQGAGVLYLNLVTIFASAFSLIWELNPAAFANLAPPTGGPGELAAMLYFSLTMLTITGYGDIVAVDPFARRLANLESVLGQFYLAITVARLVTLDWQIGAANLRCQPDLHAMR